MTAPPTPLGGAVGQSRERGGYAIASASRAPVSETVRAYIEVRDDIEFTVTAVRQELAVPVDCERCTSGLCCTFDQAHVEPPDAAAIVEIMEGRPDLADVGDIVACQLEEVSARVAAGRAHEPGAFPCPFLSAERRCRIYAVRPWVCVLTQSADRERCAAACSAGVRDPWDPSAYMVTLEAVFRRVAPSTRRALDRAVEAKRRGMVAPMTLALGMVLDAPLALGGGSGGRAP